VAVASLAPSRTASQTADRFNTDSASLASIKSDVSYLASRALGGRAAGTPGADSAAAFIARRYDALGLDGIFPSTCTGEPRCGPAYFQFFPFQNKITDNVAALVPGTDTTLRWEYIVVGAHFDHLGRTGFGVVDRDFSSGLHPGADDNASGTAAVLELARRFSDAPTKRPILFVNFGAEEYGLFGSVAFVNAPPVPRQWIQVMVNFDMIGRLRADNLIVGETGAAAQSQHFVDSAAAKRHFHTSGYGAMPNRTDENSFMEGKIPTIGFFTGLHADYHRTGDVPEKINFEGMKRIIDLAEEVIRHIGDAPLRAALHP